MCVCCFLNSNSDCVSGVAGDIDNATTPRRVMRCGPHFLFRHWLRMHPHVSRHTPLHFPFAKPMAHSFMEKNPIIKITGPLRAPYLFRIFTPADHIPHRIPQKLTSNSSNLRTSAAAEVRSAGAWLACLLGLAGAAQPKIWGGGKQIVSASSEIRATNTTTTKNV